MEKNYIGDLEQVKQLPTYYFVNRKKPGTVYYSRSRVWFGLERISQFDASIYFNEDLWDLAQI
jgi:hypothetical protein